jgi:acyl-CoA synthetase (NDP forming)
MTPAEIVLTEPESAELLAPYGIPFLPFGVAESITEAVRLAAQWPGPSVLKVVSRAILHKTDVGGVRLGVRREEVAGAYEELLQTVARRAPDCEIEGVLIQPQVEPGIEVIIGVTRDPAFGHVVLFGAGGVLSELLSEVSLRLLPVERSVAREMVLETKLARMLRGVRSRSPADIDAVCDILVRLSCVVEEHPEISELDLNPVFVHPDGATAVDALVTLVRSEDESQRRNGA